MKRVLLFALGAALALQPAPATAQIFNGTPLPLEYLNFVDGSGVAGTYGVEVGPYSARFAASPVTGRSTATPQFSVYCVDYLHFANNANGLVNVAAVGGDLSTTRLGDFGRYQRSAYLSSLFDSWQDHEVVLEAATGMSFNRRHVWSGLHSVIWGAATGPDNLGAGNLRVAAAREYFSALANSNANSFDTSGWFVLSEADVALGAAHSGQEFLVRTADVPEPSTVLLLLTGLGLLGLVSRGRLAEIV